MNRLRRHAAALLAGVTVLTVAPAAALERTLNEVWPEIDIYIRLDEHWRAMLMAGISRAADTGISTETTFGVNVDYIYTALPPAWSKTFPGVEQYWGLTTRLGYHHVAATNPAGPSEDRGVLEATVRSKPVWLGLVLANRVRADLRFVGSDFSWRGRNRIRVERSWALPLLATPAAAQRTVWRVWRSATPYLMAELFWDSRFSAWSREYYQGGVEFETRNGHSIDLFLARQYDDRVQGARITVGGIGLSLRY
jgi:hypothetical protein